MALFTWQWSRRKFLTRSALLSGLAGTIAGRVPAFAGVGKESATPLNPDGPSGGAAGANAEADASMKVWAINDSVRVDPIRNQPFEENPSLFPDGVRPGYKESNLHWDGAARRIKLKAARNETVAFQIVIERTGAKLTNVNVALADLAGPAGARIPLGNIDMFREWYVHVENPSKQSYMLGTGWYPDGLLPCLRWSGNLYPHTYVMPFDVPDPLNNVGKEQTSQALWVDIYIPKSSQDAPPGKYTAPIAVSSDQGRTELSLELQVWDFDLPEESHLKPSIYTDTEINTLAEELESKYYQLARKHRLSIKPMGYAPAVQVSGTNVEIDWRQYDARLSKYFDGSAFTEQYGYSGPGYGVPTEYIQLPFDAYPMNLYKIPRGIQLSGKEWKFYVPGRLQCPRRARRPNIAPSGKMPFRLIRPISTSTPPGTRRKWWSIF